jgi:predicted NAD/FAD-binding protein
MRITCAQNGIAIEVTGAEARVLLEEIGDVSGKARPKVRQLYRELEQTLEMFSAVERVERVRKGSGIVDISGRLVKSGAPL